MTTAKETATAAAADEVRSELTAEEVGRAKELAADLVAERGADSAMRVAAAAVKVAHERRAEEKAREKQDSAAAARRGSRADE